MHVVNNMLYFPSLTSSFSYPVLQTAQTVLLVVTAFLICWMPHHIIAMWVEFGMFPLNDASFAFRIISHCLAYGNSCVNPILYAFLSENFRKACRQVFTCHFLYPPPPVEKVVRIRMDNFSTTHSIINMWAGVDKVEYLKLWSLNQVLCQYYGIYIWINNTQYDIFV